MLRTSAHRFRRDLPLLRLAARLRRCATHPARNGEHQLPSLPLSPLRFRVRLRCGGEPQRELVEAALNVRQQVRVCCRERDLNEQVEEVRVAHHRRRAAQHGANLKRGPARRRLEARCRSVLFERPPQRGAAPLRHARVRPDEETHDWEIPLHHTPPYCAACLGPDVVVHGRRKLEEEVVLVNETEDPRSTRRRPRTSGSLSTCPCVCVCVSSI